MKKISGNRKKIADGSAPRNARVKIEYTKDKPKVSFSYPTKNGVVGSMFGVIQMCCILLIGIIILFLSLYNSYFHTDIGMKTTSLDKYNTDGLQKYIECSSKYPNEVINNYSIVRNKLCAPEAILMFQMDQKQTIRRLITILFLVSGPYLIYIPFRKRWDKLFPKYMAWKNEKKMAIYTVDDVKRNLYDYNKKWLYFVELPVFQNIVLDFKTTGDFNEYLKEIEIREHKFKYFHPKRRKKSKRLEVNEWMWYARFYFDQKPIEGDIKILFC